MALHALLLSRDPVLLVTLRRLLEEMAVKVEACPSAVVAANLLTHQKFEAFLLDVDDVEGAGELLGAVRHAPLNRSSIVFAVTHRRTSFRAAFEQGANFVLEKPLSIDRAQRSLRVAQALMLRERRRTFRHTVDTPVMIQTGPRPGHAPAAWTSAKAAWRRTCNRRRRWG